jgi:hypothetical protein
LGSGLGSGQGSGQGSGLNPEHPPRNNQMPAGTSPIMVFSWSGTLSSSIRLHFSSLWAFLPYALTALHSDVTPSHENPHFLYFGAIFAQFHQPSRKNREKVHFFLANSMARRKTKAICLNGILIS